jgi:hypothetical protein
MQAHRQLKRGKTLTVGITAMSQGLASVKPARRYFSRLFAYSRSRAIYFFLPVFILSSCLQLLPNPG